MPAARLQAPGMEKSIFTSEYATFLAPLRNAADGEGDAS